MKIGICGSQSTGKSTLAKLLAERLGLPLITEQARFVAQTMGIRSEIDLRAMAPSVQARFQQKCLQAQKIAEMAHPNGFVSDRTVVDNAAYWLAWSHAHEDTITRCGFLTDCYSWAKHYDLIIFCPREGQPPEDDGFRLTDPVYQMEIELLIHTLLVGWELHFIRVEGTPEQRVEQVVAALKEVRAA